MIQTNQKQWDQSDLKEKLRDILESQKHTIQKATEIVNKHLLQIKILREGLSK